MLLLTDSADGHVLKWAGADNVIFVMSVRVICKVCILIENIFMSIRNILIDIFCSKYKSADSDVCSLSKYCLGGIFGCHDQQIIFNFL